MKKFLIKLIPKKYIPGWGIGCTNCYSPLLVHFRNYLSFVGLVVCSNCNAKFNVSLVVTPKGSKIRIKLLNSKGKAASINDFLSFGSITEQKEVE